MSKLAKILPEDIQKKMDEWLDGFSYELIHFWESDETFYIVVFTTDSVIRCIRIFRTTYSNDIQISIDKNFNLEA